MYLYEIGNGKSGEVQITDPLIDSEPVANARANAEFLNGGYVKKYISFTTYSTNISIYDIITVKGASYRVLSALLNMDSKKISSTIKAVRYEI